MSRSGHVNGNVFRELLRIARAYRPHLALLLLLGPLAPLLKLLTPLPLKIAVDSVVGSEPAPAVVRSILDACGGDTASGLLFFVAVLMVVITLLALVLGLVNSLLSTYL